jgi:small-conductance mechanosensitive channel
MSTVASTSQSLFQTIMDLLWEGVATKGAVALLIFCVGMIIAKFAGKSLQKIGEAATNSQLWQLLGALLTYLGYGITTIISLSFLGAGTLFVDSLAVVILTISCIVLLLSLQDVLTNVLAGVLMHLRGSFKLSDVVLIDSVSGKITRIELLFITVRTSQGDTIHIPSSLFLKKSARVVHKGK